MSILVVLAFLLCVVTFVQPKETFKADYVFFEIEPYIYYKNGELNGAYVDLLNMLNAMCNVKFTLKYNVKTMQNLTYILQNPTNYEHLFNNETLWFLSTYTVSNELLQKHGLTAIKYDWVPGIEVVMHRHQIALLVKVGDAIIDCRHLICLALLLTACFGILIWIAVSLNVQVCFQLIIFLSS